MYSTSLPSELLIDPHVGRHIAINKVESEEGELGASRLKRKRKPVAARGSLGVGGLIEQRKVRPIVRQAINRLTQGQRAGGFGRVIRLGLEGDTVRDIRICVVVRRSVIRCCSDLATRTATRKGSSFRPFKSAVDGGVTEI